MLNDESLSWAILSDAVALCTAFAPMTRDAELAQLHRSAVEWRHQRFRNLMQQEPFRALFARLLMTPTSRLINPVTARTLTGFALLGRTAGGQGTGFYGGTDDNQDG